MLDTTKTDRAWSCVLAFVGLACGGPSDRDPFNATTPVGSIGSGPSDEPDDDDDDGDVDDDTSSDGGATVGDPNADDSNADDDGGADTTPAATTMPSGDTGSGDPVLDGCLDIAVDECQTCACNLCLDPLYACEQDPGCVAMRNCAEQAGCEGADCLEPCGAVIDMYGGPFGSSGALAIALSDCLSASCPICF